MSLPTFNSHHVINVKDYYLPGDPDDTLSILRALNDLDVNYGGWGIDPGSIYPVIVSIKYKYILYFPAGLYRISSRIILSGSFASLKMLGDNAVIQPTEDASFVDENQESPNYGQPMFALEHENAYNFGIEGLNFIGFHKAVRIFKNNEIDSGMLEVTNCGFQLNYLVGLEISYLSGIATIKKCKFMGSEIALNLVAADKIIIEKCWISNSANMAGLHTAPIYNGSRLTLRDCMLIPSILAPTCVEPAWINNYGSVEVYNTRQSGEENSYTLINNFAGLGDMRFSSNIPEPNWITIRDCQCYAVFGNHTEGSSPIYLQPAAARFVTAVPNQIYIENNRGFLMAKIIDFSYYYYSEDAASIEAMILSSGAAGSVMPFNISVRVSHNVGGWPHSNGTQIPNGLLPYVRDRSDLWPVKENKDLPIYGGSGVVQIDGSIIYTFEYGNEFDKKSALLIHYTGNPNVGGAAIPYGYSGAFIGIAKSNGCWNGSELQQALTLETVLNKIGDPNPAGYPTGTFNVDLYWEASGTPYLPASESNTQFCIKISGRSGGNWYDTIKVSPVTAIME